MKKIVALLMLMMLMVTGVYAVASVSAIATEVLSPDTLNGAHIYLSLTDDTLVDSTVTVNLNNAPTGVSVGSVDYIDSDEIKVTLAYDSTPVAVKVENFSVTVPMSEVVGGVALTSNNMTIYTSSVSGGLGEVGNVVAEFVDPSDGFIHKVFSLFLGNTLLVVLLGLMLFGAAVSFVMRLIYRR